MPTRPKVIDLFAGAGLYSYSFKRAGFDIIQAVELDRFAAATYARNLGNHVEVADVAEATPAGRCDVIIAGPPCQGFSTLGARRNSDPRNGLSLELLRWVEISKPRVVVIENVAAFLQSPTWSLLNSRLRRMRYDVSAFELDAVDFGVPQRRRRSFTIATRVNSRCEFRFRGSNSRPTVREAWNGLPSRPDGRNHHTAPKPSPMALERMRTIPAGGDKRDIMRKSPHLAPPSWWRLSCQVTDAWGRMEWDQPSNTLRTSLQNASKGRYIHPTQNRVISLREAARLHSIPDSWQFEGFPSHIAKQIGNSVPPRLGDAVARAVFDFL